MKNFNLIDEKYIEDVHSKVSYYEHIKTKAKIVTLENNMDNLAFGIGFRTPPKDSSGVAHIIEHSVLGTSRKYKTREPFFDLVKGSPNTFLNAMTFPDKTIYPFSSKNKKDFYNLLDVYLDCVLYPGIYETDKIFKREGWHYELRDKNDPIIINGIVYNEMKGAYASEDEQVFDALNTSLFKGTTYGVDSGGNPQDIPNLTYEAFLNFHKTYYHPSNSYIYLSGNLNMEEALSFIDENYLSHFEYKKIDSQIKTREPINEIRQINFEYPALEISKNKDYLGLAILTGKYDSAFDCIINQFLVELLLNTDASPLKNALYKKGLGLDVYGTNIDNYELAISIMAKYVDGNRKDEFLNTINETLEDLVKNGIDKDLLRATLNKFEFTIRNGGGANAQIYRFIWAMSRWLYDGSPFEGLNFSKEFKKLRNYIDGDFFEKYIEKKYLKNQDKVLLIAKPSTEKNKIIEEKLRKKLELYKNSLSEEEIENLISSTLSFDEFLSKEDSPEAKATMPKLSLDDISKDVEEIKRSVEIYKDSEILKHDQATNGITYANFYFDSSFIGNEDLFIYSVMDLLIGKLDTENYSYKDLDNEIYKVLGGFSTSPMVTLKNKSNDLIRKFLVSFPFLSDNVSNVFKIVEEIIYRTKFEDLKRIKDVLNEAKSKMEDDFISKGHLKASGLVSSYYSRVGKYNEIINGIEFYHNLCDLIENIDRDFEKIKLKIQKLYGEIFNSKNLIVNITCEEKYLEDLSPFKKFIDGLTNKKISPVPFEFKEEAKNIAYTSSSDVNFVAKGYNYKAFSEDLDGSVAVLKNILSNEYLYNEIRAKGGAYGQGMLINDQGDMIALSYRDPQLSRTLKVYDEIPNYLRNLKMDKQDLINAIIGGSISYDPNLAPEDKGLVSGLRYIRGIEISEIKKKKAEALATNLEKLKSYADLIEKVMNKNYLGVIGNKNIIEENKNIFKNIKSLKK